MSEKTLLQELNEYLSTHKVKVCILTPCYGGMCHINYTISLMHTLTFLREHGIQCKAEFCKNDSLVSRARNNLIARAMSDKDCTHFLFIDSDITWYPTDIIKLIINDKPLSGGLYPIKHYYWNKLTENPDVIKEWIEKRNQFDLLKNVSKENILKHHLVRYNMNLNRDNHEIIKNNIEVRHLATGFMIIKREVIEQMSQAFPSTKYTDDVGFLQGDEQNYAYALFDCGVEDGHYMSEDWLFCNRWRKMGGKIYADLTINLTHSGMEEYEGSIISTLL